MKNNSSISLSVKSWLMLPVYIWQGVKLRRTIERLLPAPVPQTGQIGKGDPRFHILIVGDSTVASVGMARVEDTFSYNVAKALNAQTRSTVRWRTAGANSATAGHLRDYVIPHIEERDFTHVIISVGTNDMKNFHAVSTFKKNFGTLLYAVRTRFPAAKIIWTPVTDMTKFPALSRGLGKVLSYRAALINNKGMQLCRERGALYSEPIPIKDALGFARDGFHPGPDGYRIWGEHLVPYIIENEPPLSG